MLSLDVDDDGDLAVTGVATLDPALVSVPDEVWFTSTDGSFAAPAAPAFLLGRDQATSPRSMIECSLGHAARSCTYLDLDIPGREQLGLVHDPSRPVRR